MEEREYLGGCQGCNKEITSLYGCYAHLTSRDPNVWIWWCPECYKNKLKKESENDASTLH